MPRVGMRLSDPAGRSAQMSGHSATVERFSGSGYTPIAPGGLVGRSEPLRYVGHNLLPFSGTEFFLNGPSGEVLIGDAISSGFGNASQTVTGPPDDGVYELRVAGASFSNPFTHSATTTFEVVPNPPQPPPPDKGIPWGTIVTLLVVGVVVVGITAASRSIRDVTGIIRGGGS